VPKDVAAAVDQAAYELGLSLSAHATAGNPSRKFG
jgi:hypothetical protein